MNEPERTTFQIITFGKKAEQMFHKKPYINEYISHADCKGKDVVLVVTDDAAIYETEIAQALAVVDNGSPRHLVLDMNAANDADKFRALWQHYNKVENPRTVKRFIDMTLQHLVWSNGIIPFKPHELLDTCSAGEYIGSIYVENGLDALKDVDAPSNAMALAVGVGFSFAHYATMDQMDALHEYFKRFHEDVPVKWSLACSIHAISGEDNVIIVYSYNK